MPRADALNGYQGHGLIPSESTDGGSEETSDLLYGGAAAYRAAGSKPGCCCGSGFQCKAHLVGLGLNAALLGVAMCFGAANNQFIGAAPGDWYESAEGIRGVMISTCFDDGGGGTNYSTCSQFLLDEYSVARFSHGFIMFFWLIALIRLCAGKTAPGFDWLGLYLTIALETGWKVFENQKFVIADFQQSYSADCAPPYRSAEVVLQSRL